MLIDKIQNIKYYKMFYTGVPGEIAYHGWIFPITWLVSVSVAALVAGNLFIPIFYKMKLVSVYEVHGRQFIFYFTIPFISA